MEDSIVIRDISPNDKLELASLYDKVWPENAGCFLHKTIWAIDTSEYSGVCAVDNDRIVGSRACFRANIYIGDKKIKSVQLRDSCVDKDYRRFGLFTRMNKVFLSSYFKTKDELIYNISVDASRKAYEKIGWVYINTLSNLIRIPNLFRFLIHSKCDINKMSGNIVAEKSDIPNVDLIPDELLQKRESLMIEAGLIHNRYDRETIQWRMGSDSNIRMLLVDGGGACFYKTGYKNGLHCCTIGEMFLANYSYSCFRKVLKAVEKTGKYDMVNVTVSHAHILYKYYRRALFLLNPQKVFLNHGVRVESPRMKKICLDPNKWALSDLDIDTF